MPVIEYIVLHSDTAGAFESGDGAIVQRLERCAVQVYPGPMGVLYCGADATVWCAHVVLDLYIRFDVEPISRSS